MDDRKIYGHHVTNIRSVEIALKNTALAARKAISEENDPAIRSFVSLYSLLLGAWAENRLKKLLYESRGLIQVERDDVTSIGSQIDRWLKLVELAFRRYYTIPKAPLKSTLPFTAAAYYKELVKIIDSDLRGIIEVRNKLAHGQWIYPFDTAGTGIDQSKFKLLKFENLPSLQYKKSMLTSLADIVHDLVVSLPTFERDFDKNYDRLTCAKNNLKNRCYEKYAEGLISKRQRGIQRRKQT